LLFPDGNGAVAQGSRALTLGPELAARSGESKTQRAQVG